MSSKLNPPTSAWAATSSLHLLISGICVFSVYYLSARFQLTHSAEYPDLASIWLPASAGLLALLLFGMRLLPFVGLAAGLAYAPLFLAGGDGVGAMQGWGHLLAAALLAMLQAWVVWQAWRRFVPDDLGSVHDILRFIVLGALLPLLVTTPLLAANLYWGGYLAGVPPTVVVGFSGLACMANGLMVLLATLLYLQWRDEDWSVQKDLVAWLLAIGALGVAQILVVRYQPALLYLMLPVLLLVALTNGSFVASLAAILTSMLAIMIGGSGHLLSVPSSGLVYLALLVYLLVLTLASVLSRSRYTQLRRQEEGMSRLVDERTAELRSEIELRTALAEQTRYHALLFEHISDAVIATDMNLVIRDWNRAAEQVYGWRVEEVTGHSLAEIGILDPSQGGAVDMHWLGENGTWDGEACDRHRDGHLIPIHASVSLVRDESGVPTGIMAVNRDMTEKRQAQAALEQERALLTEHVAERTADLQAANTQLLGLAKAKDEFLASMSHELRTPLNAILMLTEIMADEMAGPLTTRQRDYLSTIQEGGAHLLQLINDILDLSKLEAGKLEVEPSEVAVADLCSASVSLVKGQAAAKNISCTVEMDPEATLVQADVRRTKQILVNLLGNAVKFTPERGQIGLSVAGDRAGKVVRFTVWDTGIGIAAENLPRLFAPFVQLDSSLSRQYAGTGLGLSLAVRLARLQGGDISVESKVGEGSQFTVTLPWTPAPLPTAPPPKTKSTDEAAKVAHEGRILLVDDTPTFLMAARDYLRLHGFDVDTAASGAEALTAVQDQRPELILLDIQMPEMDGVAFARQLRADHTLEDIPVVAVTALAMPGDRERCLAAGMVDYYTKPISLHRLGEIAEHYLGSSKATPLPPPL